MGTGSLSWRFLLRLTRNLAWITTIWPDLSKFGLTMFAALLVYLSLNGFPPEGSGKVTEI